MSPPLPPAQSAVLVKADDGWFSEFQYGSGREPVPFVGTKPRRSPAAHPFAGGRLGARRSDPGRPIVLAQAPVRRVRALLRVFFPDLPVLHDGELPDDVTVRTLPYAEPVTPSRVASVP